MNVSLDRTLFPRVDAGRIASMALWPIAVMLMFHRTVILAVNGHRTDDFVPVYNASFNFLNRLPVYAENYSTVDPHYLYPPSGTVLMAPLALLNPTHSKWMFLAVSLIALVASAYLLIRLFGYRANSFLFPATLVFFFLTESVTHTLVFGNFNSFILLGMIVFLLLLKQHRDLWAGVAMGLTLCVKPTLAPLLLLPLLNRQFKTLIPAIGLPIVANLLAWPLVKDPMDFIKRTVPYLMESRDYYNSSITGTGAYFGVAPWLTILLRVAFVAMAVFSLWFLYKYYRERDELLWLATSSGVLLTTYWLVSSLGQGYYSMLLFPMVMTVLLRGSVVRNWPAWLALYGCLTFDSFASNRWEPFGRYLEYLKVPFGWSLLMIVTFCVLLFRWLDLRNADAIDEEKQATAVGATVEE